MLSKQYRLVEKEDWAKVLKRGSFLRGRAVSLKVVGSGLGKTRVGFLVRKEGARKSVVRNKVKRRLRAAVFLYRGDFKKGLDIAVIADERVLKEGFEELRAELGELFRKSRLISHE